LSHSEDFISDEHNNMVDDISVECNNLINDNDVSNEHNNLVNNKDYMVNDDNNLVKEYEDSWVNNNYNNMVNDNNDNLVNNDNDNLVNENNQDNSLCSILQNQSKNMSKTPNLNEIKLISIMKHSGRSWVWSYYQCYEAVSPYKSIVSCLVE
ncbi:6687_t:CDS:2, partial [Cetraspora pellucida]